MSSSATYNLKDIIKIIGGKTNAPVNDLQIEHLVTDSRKVLFPATSLFFALDGPRRSGTAFITDMYEKGVLAFVINDKNFESGSCPNATFIYVENVLDALQTLASHHRQRFHYPVIGITGSNGKTIVKEWLFQLLQNEFRIVRSPKSYNSQIGVPLSVWEMSDDDTLGIFEAGISITGEMENLGGIINPTIGIFTNIGEAHSEGFNSMNEKAEEKLKLFVNSEVIIYCKDYPELEKAVSDFTDKHHTKVFTWSRKLPADAEIVSLKKHVSHTVISLKYLSETQKFNIPFTDDASIENVITCICLLLYFKFPFNEIEKRCQSLSPVEMRLQLRQGINNCSVIDDSYSADLSSVAIALDFLKQQKQHKKHTLIISDILQSGKDEASLYRQLAAMLKEAKIDRIIGVGAGIFAHKASFDGIAEQHFFTSTDVLKKNLPSFNFNNEAILLKAARVFGFEEISRLLQLKMHQTVLEIDLTAMSHNLKQYQQLLHKNTRLMVMVKASGYGSGSFEIARLLQFHNVDYLAVAYTDEGVELRKAGITLPIMVMNPEESTFESLTDHGLEPELFSFGIFTAFASYIRRAAIPHYPVHLKLDTGMHRLGFEETEIEELSSVLSKHSELKVQSVFSHLAASDDLEEKDFTLKQSEVFTRCCVQLQKSTGYNFIKHIANSSGISSHPDLHMDMVRLGIGLYGVDANPVMQENLKNVTTLKTTVAQLKKVKAGDSVGYGRNARVTKDSVIATVRVGYADGYPRILGNGKGKMLVCGQLVPVVGNVCMDMTMLDVSGISDLKEGDEVLVFGNELPIWQVAQWAATISYEIMTGISGRVKRVYFEE